MSVVPLARSGGAARSVYEEMYADFLYCAQQQATGDRGTCRPNAKRSRGLGGQARIGTEPDVELIVLTDFGRHEMFPSFGVADLVTF